MVVDPNKAQKLAADPKLSVKVTANAGTGKTRVLTNRVLRLLLQGEHAGKILCLTYTKAAAAEMVDRISKQLQKWVKISDAELIEDIKNLTGEAPDDKLIMRARTLFSRTLESTPPPRIQTIHSFCQDVLKRFPLETKLPPYFEVVDDMMSKKLLEEAEHKIMMDIDNEAINYFGREASHFKFKEITKAVISNRNKIKEIVANHQGVASFFNRVCDEFGILPDDTKESVIADYFNDVQGRKSFVNNFITALKSSKNQNDVTRGVALEEAYKQSHIDSLFDICLTKKGEPRAISGVMTQKTPDFESLKESVIREQQSVFTVYEKLKKIDNAEFIKNIIKLAADFIKLYDDTKSDKAVLDYDDLISRTNQLLTKETSSAWVLFKLDGGINHILIDEAQDTSPEQWQIIKALTEDFFSGESAQENERTVFIVGDEKQSIYSFQGADPAVLSEVTEYIKDKVLAAQKQWEAVPLNTSFRTVSAVLNFVDKVFADEKNHKSITSSEDEIVHNIFRAGQAGRVEIWPLVEDEEKGNKDVKWPMPDNFGSYRDAASIQAEKIASTIRQWLDDGRILPSTGKKITPANILILLRSRDKLADLLIKYLKRKNIPVSGSDRLKIAEHIAIQDLLALTNFVLLPHEDFYLACVLKSPLFGVSEDELFELAYRRDKTSLYERIKHNPKFVGLAEDLKHLLNKADYLSIYEFYSHILDTLGGRKKFIARLGAEVNEVLDEFIQLCFNYEASNTSSLQGFLDWVTKNEIQIKRDMEKPDGEVQVMTVHGSKGLEREIVILADANSKPKFEINIVFDDKEKLFYYRKSSEESFAQINAIVEDEKIKAYDEYLRLLYVAMTRARDELYIGGLEKKNQSNVGKSWYEILSAAIGENKVIETVQEVAVEVKEDERKRADVEKLPTYFANQVPNEKELTSEVKLPKMEFDKGSIARGKKIHKILEYLTTDNAEKILANIDAEIAEKAKALLVNQQTARFFMANAIAELPIIGNIDGKPLSARIDRLLVTESEVWVVDFKTNKTPPDIVPVSYTRQLEEYSKLISMKYPDKKVRAAILWVENAQLTEVNLTESDRVHISSVENN